MFQSRVEAAPFNPEDLHGLRGRVNAETGGAYAAFRKQLVPRYSTVWRDIALGYAALGGTVAATGVTGPASIPLSAVLIGFTIAYLQLFIHEGAHFGLAANPEQNDRLANLLICWQVGTDIKSYRATHWAHHRSLGGAGDTEISYRNRLSAGFVLAMLTGLHALRIFASRKQAPTKSGRRSMKPLLTGISAHGALLIAMVAAGWWPAAVAWVGGMAICFPFFATMRQLLEHRPTKADSDGGAVNRLFGDDIFSRLFGAAGFNRHMLHHLEPQVSYTRLADLEHYLMATSAAAELDARRSSYWGAMKELVRSDSNG